MEQLYFLLILIYIFFSEKDDVLAFISCPTGNVLLVHFVVIEFKRNGVLCFTKLSAESVLWVGLLIIII